MTTGSPKGGTASGRQARLAAWLAADAGGPYPVADLARALGAAPSIVARDIVAMTRDVPGLFEDDAGRVGVDPDLTRQDMRSAFAHAPARGAS